MKVCVLALFVCLFSFLYCDAYSFPDPQHFSVRHFTDEDGLPQNSVKNIFADSIGFVWLATEDGLVRYDGIQFDIYNKQNIADLKSNRFATLRLGVDNAVYAVNDKSVYVKISNGKVLHDTPYNKEAVALDHWYERYGAPSEAVRSAGLPKRFSFDPKSTDTYVILDEQRNVIECTGDKVIFRSSSGFHRSVPFTGVDFWQFFMVQNELYFFNKRGTFSHIQRNGTVKDWTLSGDIVRDPYYHAHSDELVVFWDIISHSVLFYCNQSFYKVVKLQDGQLSTSLILSGFEIEHKEILSHYYDNNHGRLFLGSAVKGLYILDNCKFMTLSEQPAEHSSVYYAQSVFDSNHIFTSHGTIIGLDACGRRSVLKEHKENFAPGTMYTDRQGFIWVKNWNVLHKCDRNFNKLYSWTLPKEITVIGESQLGKLWIGLRAGGVYSMDISAGIKDAPRLFPDNRIADISYIESETANELLIGTTTGLWKINTRINKAYELIALRDKHIQSLNVVQPGEIWILTYEDGLFLYHRDTLTAFPVDADKILFTAHCMLLDNNNFFWITTNKGLFQVSRKDLLSYRNKKQDYLYYHYYGKKEGFNTNEFNGGCEPCGLKLPNGIFSFPSLDGMVWFNPDSIRAELPDYPLIADKVIVDHQEIPFGDTIIIPLHFGQVQFEFSTIYFGDRKNIQITYCINSYKREESIWYPVGEKNILSFSTLPPGMYQLRIRKINGFGTDNYTELSTIIRIPFPFYETNWFRFLVVLFVALLVYGYIRLRLLYVVKNNRKLEFRIARRTRKLQHTLRALEASEASLRRQTQIQEMLIASISHDIKSPMKYLLLASGRMRHFIQRKDYTALDQFNQGIGETASRVYNALDNLLQYISVQLKKGDFKFELIDMQLLVEEKVALFTGIAQNNFTRLENRIPDDTIIRTNKNLLAVIIHNLIDNAVKFTENGLITIRYESGGHKNVLLIIEDSGIGISAALMTWINNPESTRINIDSASGYHGIGLIIVKELLFAINGGIRVEAIAAGGTKIVLTIAHE